ncbi:CRISPR-associated helicase Cas3' [bacterium]|nr:CRISPR-associated helicase Cas3' [bacterium]
MSYSQFFQKATGYPPYPYQERLAEEGWPEVLRVPTGAGKTAAIILSWLYRREVLKDGATRLIFCLPMRVLVRQTVENARKWFENLGLSQRYCVYEMMGGQLEEGWELQPYDPCILVGTQDMLLSRALNRGYAMSRYRWSVPFGLLHNDAQWVFDEVQIMGVARATSVQLQAFREKESVYGQSRSLWMSATLQQDWLATVDRPAPDLLHDLSAADLSYPALDKRMRARKVLCKSTLELSKETKKDYARQLAELVFQKHSASSISLVIVNQVDRAIEVYRALQKQFKGKSGFPELILLHSRFRPEDRARKELRLEAVQKNVPADGVILVSTQVVEAGVDLSARYLLTELCPYSSFVQRLGRCNRDGNEAQGGQAEWIDLRESALPYDVEKLDRSRQMLAQLTDVCPAALREVGGFDDESESDIVLRHKDLVELFETTSDLAGEDVDVSRYIREPSLHDAQVFWRDCASENWRTEEGLPRREELCSVSLSELKAFIGADRLAFRWNYGEEIWEVADRQRIRPGQVYLLRSSSGGYDSDLGFGREHKSAVLPIGESEKAKKYDDDRLGAKELTLEQHTLDVYSEMRTLLQNIQLGELPHELLLQACLWHDYGKAHDVFQGTMYGLPSPDAPKPLPLLGKSGQKGSHHYRKGFRHEFASALAALQREADPLIVFLAAVHHGKVRFSVRPLPQEQQKAEGGLTIRGIKSGDRLPAVKFGDFEVEETILNLDVLSLGHPRGWVRTLWSLVEEYGVFRLGFLESLMRCADVVASKKEGESLEVARV